MKKISKAEVVRLLTSNKSCLLCCGLKKKDLSLEDCIAICKDIKIDENSVIRTAKAKGYRLVFSNESILDLSDYVNNEENVSEFYIDVNILLLYRLIKAGYHSNFDTESVLIYNLL